MELNEILKEYKQKTGVTNDFIAEHVGVTKSTVSRWLSGEVKKVQDNTLDKISSLIGYDIKPFLNGTVVHFQKPILGTAKAGYDYFAEENHLGYVDVTESDNKKGDYFLHITGNSMEGAKIHDGDLVFVHSCNDVRSGEIAVILIEGQEVTVKRVIKKAGMLILEAANPEVENRYFTLEEAEKLPVQIIGKVIYSKTFF